MKLVRHGLPGAERPGIVDASGNIRDLAGAVDDIAGATLLPEGQEKLRRIAVDTLPVVAPGTRLGPCVGGIGKVIGIGLNYADHASEVNRPLNQEPSFFLKATSSLCGPDDPIAIPPNATQADWEVELGVVIGRPAKGIREEDAAGHIAGYCTGMDISERATQAARGPSAAKSYDTFTPLGPWLVTADAVPDAHNLGLTCDVDGTRYQNARTTNLIFRIPRLVALLSQYFTLATGDVILTGTPAGVGKGQKPPRFLRAGNIVEVEVEGLGAQRHAVVDA